jgi:hypothetical protein
LVGADNVKKIFIVAGLVVALVITGLLFYFWHYTSTPQYSVIMILRSIKGHDWEKFQKYVDTDSLCESLIDDVSEFFTEKLEESGTGGILGNILNKGLGEALKPKIKEKFRENLQKFVESSDSDNENRGELRKKLLMNSSITCLEKEGKIAVVALNIDDGEKNVTVKLKMRKYENHWQLIEILNPGDIVKDVIKK